VILITVPITLITALRDVLGPILQVSVINESCWGKRWLPGDKPAAFQLF